MHSDNKIIIENISEHWFIKNIRKQDSFVYFVFKKFVDLFFGIIGILILIIIYPIFALLIKIESQGPVFYKQKRVGKNGKIILIRKFRTMYECSGGRCKDWREKDKSSITKVGKFLRATHIDEIPQAFNLLNGSLSFIGPRAEWEEFAQVFEKEIPFYKKRYLVNPGLIGWAQINYPPSQSVEQAKNKFEYDLYYIKNRSIMLDIIIIINSTKIFFYKN